MTRFLSQSSFSSVTLTCDLAKACDCLLWCRLRASLFFQNVKEQTQKEAKTKRVTTIIKSNAKGSREYDENVGCLTDSVLGERYTQEIEKGCLGNLIITTSGCHISCRSLSSCHWIRPTVTVIRDTSLMNNGRGPHTACVRHEVFKQINHKKGRKIGRLS